ncbi:hypothetical protein BpHYR1_044548 [Brachionus plicatilis]|uniref:Uncharacterized protein n=1 Tax=Brachionus plicatilis TaxID=10195 RepID=A0A3M7R133_BRAPC|nr:hypothetical protein BpHYR1_044548 [Brachionus plicatilis]
MNFLTKIDVNFVKFLNFVYENKLNIKCLVKPTKEIKRKAALSFAAFNFYKIKTIDFIFQQIFAALKTYELVFSSAFLIRDECFNPFITKNWGTGFDWAIIPTRCSYLCVRPEPLFKKAQEKEMSASSLSTRIEKGHIYSLI